MTEDLYAFDLAYRSDYPVICLSLIHIYWVHPAV